MAVVWFGGRCRCFLPRLINRNREQKARADQLPEKHVYNFISVVFSLDGGEPPGRLSHKLCRVRKMIGDI